MATYKVKYTLGNQSWEHYVDEVTNENVAVMVCNMAHPEIPMEAAVNVSFVCE